MPWLERTNPRINWKTKHYDFASPSTLSPSPSSSSPPSSSPKIHRSTPTHPRPSSKHRRSSSKRSHRLRLRLHPPDPSLPSFPHPSRPKSPQSSPRPYVSLTARIHPGDQVFLAFYHPATQQLSTASVDPATEPTPPPTPEIPPYLQDLTDVFSKPLADKLPPNRGHLDHSIPLEEGSKPQFGPIYSLSEVELQVLKEYIETNLEKGFIRPSSSPYGAPVLFVKKAHGRGLRLCVDYRALNSTTIKNRYPLPLASELFDRLRGAAVFTKVDLYSAFNLLRIALGDEWKTAFRTRYGHFEYLVMPFGLTNAPASFQAYINTVLREYLDDFCLAYLDDVLIYSKSPEEHHSHVRRVLKKLLENGLYCNLDKCEFSVNVVNFLGYIISPAGISMEPERISTIVEWPVPKSVLDIQIFLGFCNFYRRFIKGYSRVALAITALLKKSTEPFQWTPAAQAAFERLKFLFTHAPVLRHFDPSLPIYLYTDASGFATSAILCQYFEGRLHPIAFWSRKSTPAECNYDIHDREMLAIILAFVHWRHYLEGANHTVQVFTDHKNLEVFMSSKILNRRQARWAELLAGYDFVLVHTPGPKNPADGPSRRPDYSIDVEQPSGTLLPPSSFMSIFPDAHVATIHEVQSVSLVNLNARYASLATFTPAADLRTRLTSALSQDTLATSIDKKSPQSPWSWEDGLLFRHLAIYVPESLRLEILRSHHDDPLAGHSGIARTLDLLSRNYWFPSMSSYVKDYVSTCDSCSRGKSSRHLKHGELSPLPIPSGPWKGITCDFVVDLPVSHGFDSLLVFVDRFTKMTHLVPCNKTADAPEFAKMFLDSVVRLHGLPDSLVSDRGSIFTSHFWKSLASLLGVQGRLSTSFHPQTDGQTERMNQTVEQYLRIYCNYQQDNWCDNLPLAEFAYNNAFQSSIHCSPFYANYGYHPRFTVDLRRTKNPDIPAAKQLAESLQRSHEALIENVKSAQNTQARYYDAKHLRIEFAVGDKVWLLSPNIHTERPSKKLDWKRLGPYPVTKRLGLQAYRLQLPETMKIHPVFHVSLLEPYKSSIIPGRTRDPAPPVIVNNEEEYEVQEILDSRIRRNRLFYKVRWIGYSPVHDSWEPIAAVKNAPKLVEAFHQRYPSKPRPSSNPSSNLSLISSPLHPLPSSSFPHVRFI